MILKQNSNFNNRPFSTVSTSIKTFNLNPFFITGLIDGEGSFTTSIQKNMNYKLGWYVKTRFSITLHKRDLALILKLKEFFGRVGTISESNTRNCVLYSVESTKDLLNIIIPHFNLYKLLNQKAADFHLFTEVVKIMIKKAHRTEVGIQNFINLRASMNLGLSDIQIAQLPKTIPVSRPINKQKK
jgi:hypothetical protein